MRVGSSHAADGQNDFLSRLWPFKHESLEWAVNFFFTPLFAYFFFPRIIYPDPDDVNFPWSMYTQKPGIYCRAAAAQAVRVYFEILWESSRGQRVI